MKQLKIGWIGLGKMGAPMSLQLINAGYNVTVYNRNKEKEAAMVSAGAISANSPVSMIQQVDIVVLMISDDAAVRNVCLGEKGLLKSTATGKIIINMSTVSPAVSREMATLFLAEGNQYIDAPVSGSVKQAETAQLVIMAGGDSIAFDKCKEVLETMGKLALHIGPSGAGNTAKLAINTLLGFYAQGLAEAVVLAESNGIKTADLMNLINNAAIGNVFTKIKGDAIIQDNYQAAFALKHIVKDVGLAKDMGPSTPLADTMLNTFREANEAYGEEDIIAVIKYVRGLK